MLTLSLAIENRRFNATLVGRYLGETRTLPGQGTTRIPVQGVGFTEVNAIAGFWLFDLSGNYKITKVLTAFSTLTNLTNTRAIAANLPNGYMPNMPFAVNIGLKVGL